MLRSFAFLFMLVLLLLANPSISIAANSPDGSVLQPGTSGSLVTSSGTWTFSSATDAGGNRILLNGVNVSSGSGVRLQIANSGKLYVLNALGKWYVWTGSGYAASTAPIASTNGQCGTSNGQSLPAAPTTNLCTAGTTSAVAGTGPWTWSCAGIGGGTTQQCSATKTITVSPDGSVLQPGTSGSLVTSSGTWTFSSATDAGGNRILLNGVNVSSGSGIRLQIANSGKLYVLNAVGNWYVWTGSGYAASSAPVASANGQCGTSNGQSLPAAPTTNLCTAGTTSAVAGTGPWTWSCAGIGGGTTQQCTASKAVTVSPDGSVIQPGTGGSLVTSSGTWTFGTGVDGGGNFILLNGVRVAAGSGVQLRIANGGKLYALTAVGNWYVWTGSGYVATTSPVATTNGQCGTSNGQSLSAAPTTNLCTVGTASAVAGTGPWSWSCAGGSGGMTAQCSASMQSGSIPVLKTGKITTTAALTDQAQLCNGSRLFPAAWTWNSPDMVKQPLPATSGTPKIEQVRNGAVIATWKYLGSGICGGDNPGVYDNPQASADKNCGPFGRSHFFGSWKPGDIFLVYPAVYTGEENQPYIAQSYIPPGMTGPANLVIRGVTVGGVRPVLKVGPTGSASTTTLGQGPLYLDQIDGITIENIDIDNDHAPNRAVSRAGVYIVSSKNVTLRQMRIHGFNSSQANGILATIRGTLTLDQTEFYENGGWPDSLAHNLYITGSEAGSTVRMVNSWSHDAYAGHLFKSRTENNILEGNYFQGGTPDPGFDSAENYDVDIPNGGNAIVRNNVFVKSASGNNTNGIALAYALEGNPDNRPMSVAFEHNTFVALARFYDAAQHALIPFAFFYPSQVPSGGVLPGVSSVKVSKNLFVGYCPLGNAVSDYRGDLSETIGFPELNTDYSTSNKYLSEEQTIIGKAAYKHEAQPGVVRTAPIIGARE